MIVDVEINPEWIDEDIDYSQILNNMIVLTTNVLAGQIDKTGDPLILVVLQSMLYFEEPVSKIALLASYISDCVDVNEFIMAGLNESMLHIVDLLRVNPNENHMDRITRIGSNRIAIEVELERLGNIMSIFMNKSYRTTEDDMELYTQASTQSIMLARQLGDYMRMQSDEYWSN